MPTSTGLATLVRSMGVSSPSSAHFGQRCAFTLSTGNAMLLVRDGNAASATGGDHSTVEKLYVYESTNTARSAWTLRATITTAALTGSVTGALFVDDSLAIFALSQDHKTIRYCKMTTGTYSVSAWETVGTAGTSLTYERFDACVSSAGVPICVAGEYNSSTLAVWVDVFCRRTTTPAWVNTLRQGTDTNSFIQSTTDITVCALGTDGTGARNLIMVQGQGQGTDEGVKMWTLSVLETTGVLAQALTTRATYAIGEAAGNSTKNSRSIKVFATEGTNEWTLGIMHSEVNRRFYVVRGTFTGSTWTTTMPISNSYSSTSSANIADGGMSMTYSNDAINFIYSITNSDGVAKKQLINYTAKINRAAGTVTYPSRGFWNNNQPTTRDSYEVAGGGDRNFGFTYHDTLFVELIAAANSEVWHQSAVVAKAPTLTSPGAGSVATSSNPTLGANADLDTKYYQAYLRMEWQFASDAGFTTNLVDYVQDVSKAQAVAGTDQAGTVVKFPDKVPNSMDLGSGTWFQRARLVHYLDAVGPFSASNSFSVSHPPSAANLSPGGSIQLAYGSNGLVSFQWDFTDSSDSDSQSAFQLQIVRVSDGAVIHDSGKIISTVQSYSTTIATANKDIMLQWRVRLYDLGGAVGAYSSYNQFKVADAPAPSVTNPVLNQVLTSGVPTVQFTPTVGGGRTISKATAKITQGNTVVWSASASYTPSKASGTALSFTGDKSYLKTGQSYTVTVTATDSTGMTGTSSIQVTTLWTPPAAPTLQTADASVYNTEGRGYVTVTWSDAARDAAFAGWIIYRKDDEYDPVTNTTSTDNPWYEIARDFTTTATHTYLDYLAPANQRSQYRITQIINRFGDEVESSNSVAGATIFPKSDSYWLVEPQNADVAAAAIRIAQVTADSYNDEYEEAEYTVIGRGRHVDKGQHLGYKGSLDCQIRSSTTGGLTARQKKLALENIKKEARVLYLRNPFGDSFRVSVGDLSVTRIAGVGTSEFVDVTIPYSEVYK